MEFGFTVKARHEMGEASWQEYLAICLMQAWQNLPTCILGGRLACPLLEAHGAHVSLWETRAAQEQLS